MTTFDDAWLQEYLRTHPVQAARMVVRPIYMPAAVRPDEAEEIPEGVFQERLRTFVVEDLHWLWYHCYSSKKSTPGWPDAAILRPADALRPDEPSVLYLLELKSTHGVVSPAQHRWLAALQRVTSVHAQAAWPCDYETLRALLMRSTP